MSLIQRAGSGRIFGETPDDWLTPRRFAILLGVLVFAAYPDVLLGQRTFFFRDFGLFGYPLANHHRESFWRGEIPLWNPLSNCGLPFLAQWNTLVLYPGSLFYLVFPVSRAVAIFCLGHLFWAGLGMYFLARRWTGNRFGASVAGLTFAMNGLTLNALMWPNNIAALGWMPWVVFMMNRAWREGRRWVAHAAIVGALQMLSGAPEIILFTWGIVAILCAADAVSAGTRRGRIPVRLAAVALLVFGLSAAQLMPFLDLLQRSQRTPAFVDAGWAMPGTGWANFLVPLFRAVMSNRGVYFQNDQYWTSSYYTGIVVVALALLAVWRVRDRRVAVLGIVAVLCLVLALGDAGYLHRWLRAILPPLGFMRYPIKYVVPVVFCIPMLAAFSVAHLRRPEMHGPSRPARDFMVITGTLGAAAALIVWFAFFYTADAAENWVIARGNALIRVGFLVTAAGTLCALLKPMSPRLGKLARLGLLLLLFLDVITHTTRQNPTIDRSALEPGGLTARAMNPVPRHGHSRALLTPEADRKLRFSASSDPGADYRINRLGLFSNCNLLEGIPKVNGFFSLYLREAEDIYWLIYGNTNRPPPALCDFLSVSQITRPGEFYEWQARESFLPMASVGMKPAFAEAALAGLVATNFNPREVVFLPPEAAVFVGVTNQARATILRSRFAPHECDVEVEAAQNTLLAISQSHYHPWRADVDGRPEKIWRANHAFQAVQVPAGRHRIKLIYEDRAFHGGSLLSVVALGICLALRLMPAMKQAGAGRDSDERLDS